MEPMPVEPASARLLDGLAKYLPGREGKPAPTARPILGTVSVMVVLLLG
jgi:hypothetical protein